MMVELVLGVSDEKLRQRLLTELEPTLSNLVRIAEQWQVPGGGNIMPDGVASCVIDPT